MESLIGNISIQGVKLIEKTRYDDNRGSFAKFYSSEIFQTTGFSPVELFFTSSTKNVFRGMHLQTGQHQTSKIVFVLKGKISDFLLDLRKDSESYSVINRIELTEETPFSLFIPKGVAHGYHVVSSQAIVGYMMDGDFCSRCDSGVSPSRILNFLQDIDILTMSLRDKNLPKDLDIKNDQH